MKVNPFEPNKPVPVGMFAGRMKEIDLLEKGLHQAKNGKATNYLITGERGIGKSSLMGWMSPLARGRFKSPDYDKFQFVTVSISISDRMTLTTMIKLIDTNLRRSMGKIETIKKFMEDTWSFVQRIKVMDSSIDKITKPDDSDLLIDDFAHSLAETCLRITNPQQGETKKDGIVFFIDEADNACPALHIGYFFKVLSELLQQNECQNVMFVVAGLPDVVEKLSESHPSSVRIFNQIKISELRVADRHYVVKKGIEEGNNINPENTSITEEAISAISTLSEGYPHFIQQFAYSAFDVNDDGEISVDDVQNGAFADGGALDSIGDRYYVSNYHGKIKSDEYRQVLSIMAENLNSWIKKSEIREKFTGDDQTLTDALRALTTRKIVLKNSAKIGEYRLQQRGFALWIKLFGERKKDL